jgi:hypothetical protein
MQNLSPAFTTIGKQDGHCKENRRENYSKKPQLAPGSLDGRIRRTNRKLETGI